MAEVSKIEWCDSTFNPWWGCTKVSAACDFCYAEALDKRTGGSHWGPKVDRRRTSPQNWKQPLKWQRQADAFEAEHGRPQKVFCASMADVFDNQVPKEWRDDLWNLIRSCDRLTWLLLTKRPQNIKKMLPDDWGDGWPQVWLGMTTEDQVEFDRRWPALRELPATVRFISYEPALAPLVLPDDFLSLGNRAWGIAGGESGTKARPPHPDWFRSLRDQCTAAGVPYLFKQWGEWEPRLVIQVAEGARDCAPGTIEINSPSIAYAGHGRTVTLLKRVGKKAAGRLLDGRTWDEMPEVAR